ncbi:hypothetical protein ACIG47_24760, partial [Promicromonospora sp. NPDC052451]
THHGWTPTRNPTTGTTTWTAPTGHTYTRPATQVGTVCEDVTSLADETRRRLGTEHDDGRQEVPRPDLPVPDDPPF